MFFFFVPDPFGWQCNNAFLRDRNYRFESHIGIRAFNAIRLRGRRYRRPSEHMRRGTGGRQSGKNIWTKLKKKMTVGKVVVSRSCPPPPYARARWGWNAFKRPKRI